jgi:hypothetical protein
MGPVCRTVEIPLTVARGSGMLEPVPEPDARRLWTLLEPVHALTYFAPQARAATEAIGLRGFWRGYFATRLGPLGPIDAPLATAVLFGFRPQMVARAVPGIWPLAAPADALRARLDGVEPVLRELWDLADPGLERAAALLRQAAAAAPIAGRPLFAANAALAWPAQPHLAVWHGCTLLREHRGDGHVAALTAAGLDGAESLVTHAATDAAPGEWLQRARGWTEPEWQAATDRLTRRGWLAEGVLTPAGAAGRAGIESATDRAAERAFATLTADERDELAALLAELAAPVIASGIVPYPNPIGVPRA